MTSYMKSMLTSHASNVYDMYTLLSVKLNVYSYSGEHIIYYKNDASERFARFYAIVNTKNSI